VGAGTPIGGLTADFNGILYTNPPSIGAYEYSAPLTHGECGSANGQSIIVAPKALCKAGTPSTVSGTGPWAWNCVGLNGGITVPCSASLPPVQLVDVSGGAYFNSITSAYAATTTSSETISAQAVASGENLLFDKPVAVQLKGGFDGSFANNANSFTIIGTLIIKNGRLTVENIILK
jgi:hypothetical protein